MARIRYAVAGLGHISQVAVLPAFAHAENSELAALFTGHPEKAADLSQKYYAPAFSYADFEHALEEQEIDAVFIALPNTLHREYTERAAAMGVHVLCEKPMATTEEDCIGMIRRCAEARVHLMIAYRLHFTDAHVRAIEMVKKGELGDLRFFSSLFSMQVEPGNIRVKNEAGGGPLFDIGIYCVNAARYLFRDEPLQVLASSASADDPRFAEVDEMTSAILRFPGDRLATFTCSFGSSDRDELDLVGTKGSLRIEPAYTYIGERNWLVKRGAEVDSIAFSASDQFAGELIYFSKCIQTGKRPEPSGEEGLADVRIINALQESARSGGLVTIVPIRKDDRPRKAQEIKRPPLEKRPSTVAVSAPSRD